MLAQEYLPRNLPLSAQCGLFTSVQCAEFIQGYSVGKKTLLKVKVKNSVEIPLY